MKCLPAILYFMCCTIQVNAQNEPYVQSEHIKKLVDSLSFINSDPLTDCKSVVWTIFKYRKDAIPFLISKISDTTITPTWYECKETNMRVGDWAYFILEKLVSLPTYSILGKQFCVYRGPCHMGVYQYLEENRQLFQLQHRRWYEKDKNELYWVKLEPKYVTGCRLWHNVNGYYYIGKPP